MSTKKNTQSKDLKKGRKEVNPSALYQSLKNACAITGLSTSYLRTGCKNHTIPHIIVGQAYYIHMPSLLESLDPHTSERRVANE